MREEDHTQGALISSPTRPSDVTHEVHYRLALIDNVLRVQIQIQFAVKRHT
jgi:hypothetical protein